MLSVLLVIVHQILEVCNLIVKATIHTINLGNCTSICRINPEKAVTSKTHVVNVKMQKLQVNKVKLAPSYSWIKCNLS